MKVNAVNAGIMIVFMASVVGAGESAPAPDMEMLEYLGTFETAGGKAVDPLDLQETPLPKKKVKGRTADKKVQDKKQKAQTQKKEQTPRKDAPDE